MAPKTELTDEQKTLRRRAAKTIARALWLVDYRAENPEATKEDAAAAWVEVRKEQTARGMRAMRALERMNMAVVQSAPEEDAQDAA